MKVKYTEDGVFYKELKISGRQATDILREFGIDGDYISISGDFHNKKLVIKHKEEAIVCYIVKMHKGKYNVYDINKTKTPSNVLYLKLWEKLAQIADEQEGDVNDK